MRESRYNVVVERGELTWVHNGLSGQVLAMPTREWADALSFLESDHARAAPAETLRDLTLARMLVTDDADELGVLEQRYRKATSDRTRFALTIVTSLGCNFDCPYCFEAKHPLPPPNNNLGGSNSFWKSRSALGVPDLMFRPLQVPLVSGEIGTQ